MRATVARERRGPEPAVARQAARIHLAAQLDAALRGFWADHRSEPALRLCCARTPGRRRAPPRPHGRVPEALDFPRGPRRPRRAEGFETQACDSLERPAGDVAPPRGARRTARSRPAPGPRPSADTLQS